MSIKIDDTPSFEGKVSREETAKLMDSMHTHVLVGLVKPEDAIHKVKEDEKHPPHGYLAILNHGEERLQSYALFQSMLADDTMRRIVLNAASFFVQHDKGETNE